MHKGTIKRMAKQQTIKTKETSESLLPGLPGIQIIQTCAPDHFFRLKTTLLNRLIDRTEDRLNRPPGIELMNWSCFNMRQSLETLSSRFKMLFGVDQGLSTLLYYYLVTSNKRRISDQQLLFLDIAPSIWSQTFSACFFIYLMSYQKKLDYSPNI
jgi:hypothetical protein